MSDLRVGALKIWLEEIDFDESHVFWIWGLCWQCELLIDFGTIDLTLFGVSRKTCDYSKMRKSEPGVGINFAKIITKQFPEALQVLKHF